MQSCQNPISENEKIACCSTQKYNYCMCDKPSTIQWANACCKTYDVCERYCVNQCQYTNYLQEKCCSKFNLFCNNCNLNQTQLTKEQQKWCCDNKNQHCNSCSHEKCTRLKLYKPYECCCDGNNIKQTKYYLYYPNQMFKNVNVCLDSYEKEIQGNQNNNSDKNNTDKNNTDKNNTDKNNTNNETNDKTNDETNDETKDETNDKNKTNISAIPNHKDQYNNSNNSNNTNNTNNTNNNTNNNNTTNNQNQTYYNKCINDKVYLAKDQCIHNNTLYEAKWWTNKLPTNGSQEWKKLKQLSQNDINLKEKNRLINKDYLKVGYYPEWAIYGRNYQIENIPADKMDIVLYSFVLCQPTPEDHAKFDWQYKYKYNPQIQPGTIIFHDQYAAEKNLSQISQLRSKNPNLKILVSLGGWSLSWNLSTIAKNPQYRKNLIKSAVKLMEQYDLDGLDIDWEYVGEKGPDYNVFDPVNDEINFKKLLEELRTEFKDKYLITAATGARPSVIKRYKGTEQFLDYIFLMTYDYKGSWGEVGHHSPLYGDDEWNSNFGIQSLIDQGFNKNQVLIGSPFYARGWDNYKNPKQLKISKSLSKYGEPGLSFYDDILTNIKQNKLQYKYDNKNKAAAAFNDTTYWSFESKESLQAKIDYVKEQKIKGIFYWDLTLDSKQDSLIDLINNKL